MEAEFAAVTLTDRKTPVFEITQLCVLSDVVKSFECRTPLSLSWHYKSEMTPSNAYLSFTVKKMEGPCVENPGRYRITGCVNSPGLQGTLVFSIDYKTGRAVPSTTVFSPSEGIW